MPKAFSIIFAESAVADLEEIREYYREQQVPEIEDRFVREVIAKIEDLPNIPGQGTSCPEFNQSKLRD